ncbi:MAG: hypothetical protein ABR875_02555 [Minisyncoccia bacterium]
MIKTKVKPILTAIILFFVFSTIFLSVVSVQAADFQVTFQNHPLFKNANFIPGDSITRWIKVVNNSGQNQTVLIKSDNASDPNHMDGAMNLTIKQGTATLYQNSFADFLSGDLIALSELDSGKSAQYNLTVTFDLSADDLYQNKTLGFNILVGFEPTGYEQSDTGTTFLTDNPDNKVEVVTMTPTPSIISSSPTPTPSASATPSPRLKPSVSPILLRSSPAPVIVHNISSATTLSANSLATPNLPPSLTTANPVRQPQLALILGVSPTRWLIYIFISLFVGIVSYVISKKWFKN